MTVAVFVLYGDTMTADATMMVETCKWHGYEVIQLADDVAPRIAGVDHLFRAPIDMKKQELWRYERLQEVTPPFVSLDTDLLVVKDISDGFDPDYDAVLTERPASGTPFNSGVFFVHSPKFIPECVRRIKEMRPGDQNWGGGQSAMRDIRHDGQMKIKSLPCSEWNDSKHVKVGTYSGARVLHFKGGRKPHMRSMYEERKRARK